MLTLTPDIAHSYRNFHAVGADYICLHRSPFLTLKVYTFEDRPKRMLDVICPHDHRYEFMSWCVRGEVINHLYDIVQPDMPGAANADVYDLYTYDTPLNGGAGFSLATRRLLLYPWVPIVYGPGQSYFTPRRDIHTISVAPDTVVLLAQFQDTPYVKTSRTFFPEGSRPPSLDPLYRPFTEPEMDAKMRWLGPLLQPFLARLPEH